MAIFACVVKGSGLIKMWKYGQGAFLDRQEQEENITEGAIDLL